MSTYENPYAAPQKKLDLNYRPVNLDPQKIEPIDLSVLSAPDQDAEVPTTPESGKEFGENVLKNADGIMKFGAQQFNNFNTQSRSSKESKAQTVASGAQGASLGMQIAGPWGAAAGAVVGTGLGLLDAGNDTKKRIEEDDEEFRNMLAQRKEDRKQSYELSQGKSQSRSEGAIRSKQNQFINRYS